MGQKVGLLTVPWLPVLIGTDKIWTVINWSVITNPNPNPNVNTNSKPNTNPNPKSNRHKNPNPNSSPNPVLTVQISTVQISPGNFTVQILTVQISSGYPFILPLLRRQFVTNNTKFAPTLYTGTGQCMNHAPAVLAAPVAYCIHGRIIHQAKNRQTVQNVN